MKGEEAETQAWGLQERPLQSKNGLNMGRNPLQRSEFSGTGSVQVKGALPQPSRKNPLAPTNQRRSSNDNQQAFE